MITILQQQKQNNDNNKNNNNNKVDKLFIQTKYCIEDARISAQQEAQKFLQDRTI